jgi:hypothetical protein
VCDCLADVTRIHVSNVKSAFLHLLNFMVSKSSGKLCEFRKRFLTLGCVFHRDLCGLPQHSVCDFASLLSLLRKFFVQATSVSCTDWLIFLHFTFEIWTAPLCRVAMSELPDLCEFLQSSGRLLFSSLSYGAYARNYIHRILCRLWAKPDRRNGRTETK